MSLETIKSSKTFSSIYKQAKSWHTPAFVCFFVPADQRQFGFVASKKVGNAVKRNRAKRLLRELARSSTTCGGQFVLVAKSPILETKFEALKDQIDRAFKQVTQEKRIKA